MRRDRLPGDDALMRTRLTTLLAVIGAATVLVLAANTVAIAASGKGFLLGTTNKTAKPTTLQRTKPGPALSLKTKSGPPLAVNSKKLVKNLNADTVDGYDSKAMVNGGTLYQISIPASAPLNSRIDALPVTPGQYQVTWSAHLGINHVTTVRCGVGVLTTGPVALMGTTAGSSAPTSVNDEAMLSGTGPITVPAGQKLFFQCFNDGHYDMTTKFPIQVLVTPIRTTSAVPSTFSRTAAPIR